MNTEIASAVKVFEEIEKTRKSVQIRQTHLAKNMLCLDCERDWMPKSSEPCPKCGSVKTKLLKVQVKCSECENIWKPSGVLRCTWCGSLNVRPNPKVDKYIENVALPRLLLEEEFYEKQMKKMVHDHPVWEWAEQVKGVGETSLGRMLSKTDIRRCTTLSKFWAHCGFGLDAEGKPQRKHAGEKITYNKELQSNCVMVGKQLMLAQGAYYQQYLKFKDSRNGLTPSHAQNHGFRLMIKLFLAHLWETWRIAEGLEAPQPYAFAILKHPNEHYISPLEMCQSKPTKSKKQ